MKKYWQLAYIFFVEYGTSKHQMGNLQMNTSCASSSWGSFGFQEGALLWVTHTIPSLLTPEVLFWWFPFTWTFETRRCGVEKACWHHRWWWIRNNWLSPIYYTLCFYKEPVSVGLVCPNPDSRDLNIIKMSFVTCLDSTCILNISLLSCVFETLYISFDSSSSMWKLKICWDLFSPAETFCFSKD